MISKRIKEKAKQIMEGNYTTPEKQKVALTFELTEKQYKKYQRWRNAKKKKEGELYVGAIGGAYTFCFTPTGIGDFIEVKSSDGDKLDLTDFDSW
jgi:hypothetical protein